MPFERHSVERKETIWLIYQIQQVKPKSWLLNRSKEIWYYRGWLSHVALCSLLPLYPLIYIYIFICHDNHGPTASWNKLLFGKNIYLIIWNHIVQKLPAQPIFYEAHILSNLTMTMCIPTHELVRALDAKMSVNISRHKKPSLIKTGRTEWG